MTPEQLMSIALFAGVTRLVVTASLAAYGWMNRTYPGFGWWVAANAAGSMVLFAHLFRVVDLGTSVLLANLSLTLSALFFLDGTRRFVLGRPLDRRWYGLCGVSLAWCGFFYWGVDSLLARLGWDLVPALLAVAVGRTWLRGGLPLYRAACLLSWAYGAALGVRVLVWTFGPWHPDLLLGGGREAWFFLFIAVLDLVNQVVCLLANSLRLEADVRAANRDLETTLRDLGESSATVDLLSGILPICASCRQIQDEEGAWVSVEAYVQDRSEARFSHGLCPGCIERLYPDLVEEGV